MQVPDAWPNTFRQARFLSAVDFVQTDRFRRKVAKEMSRVFSQVDLLLVPSLRDEMLTITNATGHPSLTLRAGFIEVSEERSDWAPDPATPAGQIFAAQAGASWRHPDRPAVRRGQVGKRWSGIGTQLRRCGPAAAGVLMQVLESIRVVELTEALAGPYCAMMLGDFGADVIKVERRQTGDQSRSWGPPFVGRESAYFLATNRNKRSLSLDYDQPQGAEILHRLLATADVFLINQRNRASLERRGFDAETICARYPRLVYCAISGYGHSGPRSGLPGYDIIAQAQAGIMSFTGEPEGEPVRYPIAIADMACGLYSALGILAALLAREKTGTGQALDMALFDSQLSLLVNAGSNYLNAGRVSTARGEMHIPALFPTRCFAAETAAILSLPLAPMRFGIDFFGSSMRRRHWELTHAFAPMHCGRNIGRC